MPFAEASSVTVPCGVAFIGLDADRVVVWLRGEHDVSTVMLLWETMNADPVGDERLISVAGCGGP